MTTTLINGNSYSNISKGYVGAGGRIIIFSWRWNIGPVRKVHRIFLIGGHQQKFRRGQAAESALAENNLERAIMPRFS